MTGTLHLALYVQLAIAISPHQCCGTMERGPVWHRNKVVCPWPNCYMLHVTTYAFQEPARLVSVVWLRNLKHA